MLRLVRRLRHQKVSKEIANKYGGLR